MASTRSESMNWAARAADRQGRAMDEPTPSSTERWRRGRWMMVGTRDACSSPDGPMESPHSNTASEVIWGNANPKNFEEVSTPAHQEYGTAVGLMANRSAIAAPRRRV
mgnify:FL=1